MDIMNLIFCIVFFAIAVFLICRKCGVSCADDSEPEGSEDIYTPSHASPTSPRNHAPAITVRLRDRPPEVPSAPPVTSPLLYPLQINMPEPSSSSERTVTIADQPSSSRAEDSPPSYEQVMRNKALYQFSPEK